MDQIQFTLPSVTPVNITDLFINLMFCVVAAFLLRSLYVRKSISLSGKFHIGTVIPILAVVTFLVIMVVKSSLALSLGLFVVVSEVSTEEVARRIHAWMARTWDFLTDELDAEEFEEYKHCMSPEDSKVRRGTNTLLNFIIFIIF